MAVVNKKKSLISVGQEVFLVSVNISGEVLEKKTVLVSKVGKEKFEVLHNDKKLSGNYSSEKQFTIGLVSMGWNDICQIYLNEKDFETEKEFKEKTLSGELMKLSAENKVKLLEFLNNLS